MNAKQQVALLSTVPRCAVGFLTVMLLMTHAHDVRAESCPLGQAPYDGMCRSLKEISRLQRQSDNPKPEHHSGTRRRNQEGAHQCSDPSTVSAEQQRHWEAERQTEQSRQAQEAYTRKRAHEAAEARQRDAERQHQKAEESARAQQHANRAQKAADRKESQRQQKLGEQALKRDLFETAIDHLSMAMTFDSSNTEAARLRHKAQEERRKAEEEEFESHKRSIPTSEHLNWAETRWEGFSARMSGWGLVLPWAWRLGLGSTGDIVAHIIPNIQWYEFEIRGESIALLNVNWTPLSFAVAPTPHFKLRIEAGLASSTYNDVNINAPFDGITDLAIQVGLTLNFRFRESTFWSFTNLESRTLLTFGARVDGRSVDEPDHYLVDSSLAYHLRFPIADDAWISFAPELRLVYLIEPDLTSPYYAAIADLGDEYMDEYLDEYLAYFGEPQNYESLSLFGGMRAQIDIGQWSIVAWYNRGIANIQGDHEPFNHWGFQLGKFW
jgi:hypothetical protein